MKDDSKSYIIYYFTCITCRNFVFLSSLATRRATSTPFHYGISITPMQIGGSSGKQSRNLSKIFLNFYIFSLAISLISVGRELNSLGPSILIKFSVVLSVCVSVCLSVCSTLETLLLKLFCKKNFHLLEQALGSVLVKSEFKYLKQFLKKTKITA